MKLKNYLAGGAMLGATGLLLAGCSGWSYDPPIRGNVLTEPFNVPAARSAAPQSPSNFNQALASDYASFASTLSGEYHDWADADYFSRKGLAAADNKLVPPENNANWLVPLEVPEKFRTRLAEGRTRLVAALDGGGRERMPAVAARAQSSYDCWVERMEDDWKSAAEGPCYQQFMSALAQLENKPAPTPAAQPAPAPAAPAREYRVYFEFDKADLLPEAQEIINRAADAVKQNPATRVQLIGKTDTAGSAPYNLGLSKRRADTVRHALTTAGVPNANIEERWVGKTEPPVPTPDNTREPRNRVVEIQLH
jgi:OOP family OmpA-OmpF porin